MEIDMERDGDVASISKLKDDYFPEFHQLNLECCVQILWLQLSHPEIKSLKNRFNSN